MYEKDINFNEYTPNKRHDSLDDINEDEFLNEYKDNDE